MEEIRIEADSQVLAELRAMWERLLTEAVSELPHVTREELTGSGLRLRMDDLDDRLDALYAGPPGEFIATRNALAKALKADGQDEEAARVAALRRPTKLAAELNRLAGERGTRWRPSSTPRPRWPAPRPRCWTARATRGRWGRRCRPRRRRSPRSRPTRRWPPRSGPPPAARRSARTCAAAA